MPNPNLISFNTYSGISGMPFVYVCLTLCSMIQRCSLAAGCSTGEPCGGEHLAADSTADPSVGSPKSHSDVPWRCRGGVASGWRDHGVIHKESDRLKESLT